MIKVAVITISDTCSTSEREDVSGNVLCDIIAGDAFEVSDYKIVPDEPEDIKNELIRLADEAKIDIVLTTGGTGLGPRDVTPEATTAVCRRMVPGLAEVIRSEGLKKTRNAMLSRGVAGIREKTLIINLPGSPKGATESLEAILDVLPHARDMLLGQGH
jgi:molybdopterin adenylyltransferase